MSTGVYLAEKKDGTLYYRSNITYRDKHISLGSFSNERDAHQAYLESSALLNNRRITLDNYCSHTKHLSFEKAVSLLNYRDNGMYIKNPIYLQPKFFLYFLSERIELKFDIDDLFFYSRHKIIKRNGHLFVNEYGMQTGILSRYGVKSYAVAGVDYIFANNDSYDYRYENIIVINRYRGVSKITRYGITKYKAYIHINGNYNIGLYSTEEKAAIAYNKAVDLARAAGISRNFQENYITDFSAKDYADIYTRLKISDRYLQYLASVSESYTKLPY